jgi:hypothetical protein
MSNLIRGQGEDNMNKVICLVFCVIVFCGCNNHSSNTNTLNVIKVDSTALKDSLFKVELIEKEGIKAIGNINFYVSEKEFEKQVDSFKNPLWNKGIGKKGLYSLGEYQFNVIDGNFLNDSLFNVHIWGSKINYDDYEIEMPNQCNALLSILTEKYGIPNEKNELPAWSNMSNNDVKFIAKWNLGFKNLLVWVVCFGSDYRLDFCYYVPEIADRKKILEKRETKNTNQKAAEIL